MTTALSVHRTQVLARMGLPSTDGLIDSTALNTAINDALDDISRRYAWPWLEAEETIAMVDGTDSYTPAADWTQTVSCRVTSVDTQWLPMQRLRDLGMVDALQQGAGVEGTPVFFAVWSGKLYFVPTPSATMNVLHRYRAAETALSADGDTPLLPSYHDNLVTEYAAAVLFRTSRQLDDSVIAMERYERMLEDMAVQYGLRTQFSPSQGGGSGPQEST